MLGLPCKLFEFYKNIENYVYEKSLEVISNKVKEMHRQKNLIDKRKLYNQKVLRLTRSFCDTW